MLPAFSRLSGDQEYLIGRLRLVLGVALIIGPCLAFPLVTAAGTVLVLVLFPLLGVMVAMPEVHEKRWNRLLYLAWIASVGLLLVAALYDRSHHPGASLEHTLSIGMAVVLTLIFLFLRRSIPFRAGRGHKRSGSSVQEETFQRLLHEMEGRSHHQSKMLAEMKRRTHQLSLLNEIGDLTRTCRSVEECYVAIGTLCQHLFPTLSGAMAVEQGGTEELLVVSVWGRVATKERFNRAACAAICNGPDRREEGGSSVANNCRHLLQPAANALCEPIQARGKTVGILHLSDNSANRLSEDEKRLARLTAQQIARVLLGFELMESVQRQSLTDPLTGLYSQGYMKASLLRELQRSYRNRSPVVIMKIDVDAFQGYNAEFGYEAGDHFLQQLAQYLRDNVRASDIACRTGGDEFVLVLPEMPRENGRWRAEQLRRGVATLPVQRPECIIGRVTVSIGVACFPENGWRLDSLLDAAGTALLSAQAEGGNRVK